MSDDHPSSVLRDRDGLTVRAERREDGAVVILGHDLSGRIWSEYEYAITVRGQDVPLLVSALGGSPESDVLDLLAAAGEEIVAAGERSWLAERSVPCLLWNRVEP